MAFVRFSLVPWSQDSRALEDSVLLGTILSGKVLAGDERALVAGWVGRGEGLMLSPEKSAPSSHPGLSILGRRC